MSIQIGNAPCSWGIEFAQDPRYPCWEDVLRECALAGYTGIELGPVGYLPEDPNRLADTLGRYGLTLIGGVLFRPFHDPSAWEDILDGAHRTCRALVAHGAQHFVLIDSISPRRAQTAGRANEAEQMDRCEWSAFVDRIRTTAQIGANDYGLTVGIHAHAAGFMDFEPELERLLDAIDVSTLKICLDTGHHSYAGYDPVAFMRRHIDRISYIHFKDISPTVKSDVVANRTGFYEACAQGIFCRLGDGDVDFPSIRTLLLDRKFDGWCTVEQDCDPSGATSPIDDARANRAYLHSIGI
ncbi:MAG: sugar phosphate isomerase/epimerase family protein [Hyphomicrobiaceae bacterium]